METKDHIPRAPRNRTITLTSEERKHFGSSISREKDMRPEGVIHGDFRKCIADIPASSVDLLFLDPPYNLDKSFNGTKFIRQKVEDYTDWLNEVILALKPLLKPTATIYVCGDWLTSVSIYEVASRHFIVRNRITWEREKGRGAKRNWKNSSEDIWFCTVSDDFTFNVDAVKLRRKVVAPYTNDDGTPKDWLREESGNYRDTHPSNIWTDITIPFWSMPENTDHPTQKSEKLLAKLLLASTNVGDFILDPFLGSGTSAVVAHKLRRKYIGIEIDEEYCLYAVKRLEMAERDASIQGFADGIFWERNTLSQQQKPMKSGQGQFKQNLDLFDNLSVET